MGYSADILASTLQDLLPGYVDTFTAYHPLWDRIRKGGKFNKRKLKGPWVDFAVVTGGPGYAVTDRTGSTTLAGGRRQNAKRGLEYPARLIYHFNVPHKDLEEAESEYDLVDLVDNYGDTAMADLAERMARQVARGASSSGSDPEGGGVDGFFTFNGSQTFAPQDASAGRSGLFQALAKGSQTNTVHGLPMSGAGSDPVTGWEHQYAHIDSFDQHGRKVMRSTLQKADQEGAGLTGGMDLLVGDDGSYQNYLEDLDDQVQVAVVENDKGKGKVRNGVKFLQADFFTDPAIDLSDTTAFSDALMQTGVIYGMTTEDFEMIMLGSKGVNGEDFFRVEEPIRLSEAPMSHFRMSCYANIFCKQLRRQMLITGGANA